MNMYKHVCTYVCVCMFLGEMRACAPTHTTNAKNVDNRMKTHFLSHKYARTQNTHTHTQTHEYTQTPTWADARTRNHTHANTST